MIKAILTIDDMPQNNTKAISDYLEGEGITPVFFGIGELLLNNPEPAIYVLRKGLVIGNHTFSHKNLGEVSFEDGIEEIEKAETVLNDIYAKAGVERKYKIFRFPYLNDGEENREKYAEYLRAHGFMKVDDSEVINEWYTSSGWKTAPHVSCSFDCEEYMLRPGSPKTFDQILDKIDAEFSSKIDQTHIILTHSHDETEEREPEYVRKIVERIRSNGAEFVKPVFTYC